MQYIDIGANLTHARLCNKVDEILIESASCGVSAIIITGSTYDNSVDALDMCNKNEASGNFKCKLYSTIGVHPHNALRFNNNMLNKINDLIEKNLQNNSLVAIGECGLDYDRMFSDKDSQTRCFQQHIMLAQKHNLPLFLHERDAFDDFYHIMKNTKNVTGVVHCFTGNYDQLKSYIDLGLYIGITGWICDDKRNSNLVNALVKMSSDAHSKEQLLNRLMIETDSPFLSPVLSKTSKDNMPKNISFVAEKVASTIGSTPQEIAQICFYNTVEFFGLKFFGYKPKPIVEPLIKSSNESSNEKPRGETAIAKNEPKGFSYRDMLMKNASK